MEINGSEQELDDIREKRAKLLVGLWCYFLKTGYFKKDNLTLSSPLINEIVEHYIIDVSILKFRYKIPKLIERSKIAGLMTSLVMRYRPILLGPQNCNEVTELYANEIFAIIHGLAVCFEDSIIQATDLLDKPWFKQWFDDFRYLLHFRHHTPESLAFIFKTVLILTNSTDRESL